MPTLNDLTGTPRKEMHVFYVLDTSGSMAGAKISMLNHAMEECTDALKDLAKSNADAELKVAVLEFNSGCKWITSNGPEALEDFEWDALEAGGLTDMGCALGELNDKMSRHAFLNSMTGALMPVIIFMTDGFATDNYIPALDEIRKNRWFARGTKIGFAIGDDVDEKMIASVVGNSEAVIKTTDLDLFCRLMKFVSVTASMLVSQSATTATATTGAQIVDMIKSSGELPDTVKIGVSVDEYYPEPDTDTGAASDDWDDDEEW